MTTAFSPRGTEVTNVFNIVLLILLLLHSKQMEKQKYVFTLEEHKIKRSQTKQSKIKWSRIIPRKKSVNKNIYFSNSNQFSFKFSIIALSDTVTTTIPTLLTTDGFFVKTN